MSQKQKETGWLMESCFHSTLTCQNVSNKLISPHLCFKSGGKHTTHNNTMGSVSDHKHSLSKRTYNHVYLVSSLLESCVNAIKKSNVSFCTVLTEPKANQGREGTETWNVFYTVNKIKNDCLLDYFQMDDLPVSTILASPLTGAVDS